MSFLARFYDGMRRSDFAGAFPFLNRVHSSSNDKLVADATPPLDVSASPSPVKSFVMHITDASTAAPQDFFRLLDEAKLAFFEETSDDLETQLLGIKISNLLVAKYEYQRGSVVTVAHPVSFMLDTANQCQLGCPSCTNSFNREVANATFNSWPRGILKEERFNAFIRSVGISAFAGHFYNNHEPFLNKNTPAFLRVASDMQIETFVSSNLSFPKLDHEAIVKSGLKELMVALDGVTQESYEKYRKGGRLDWAFANVRALADAKKRLGSTTPYIRWQWLTFEHNVHEVERGIEVAREVGFDCFNLATPNRVDHDDPTVHAVQYEGPQENCAVVFNPRQPGNFSSDLTPYREVIEASLQESSYERWLKAGGLEVEQPVDKTGDRCDWLHMAVISDAKGRIVPCCIGDYKDNGKFIFSTIDEDHENVLNSRLYQESRMLLINPAAYRKATVDQDKSERTRCFTCPIRPKPQIGLGAVHSWFVWSGSGERTGLSPSELSSLYDWSRHVDVRPNYQTASVSFIAELPGERLHNALKFGPLDTIECVMEESDTELYAIDLYVRSKDRVVVDLKLGENTVDSASAGGSDWLHFRLHRMQTPGDYVVGVTIKDDSQRLRAVVATVRVLAGATVGIRRAEPSEAATLTLPQLH